MDILTISDVSDDIISGPEPFASDQFSHHKSDGVSSTTADLSKNDENRPIRREKKSSDKDQAKRKSRSPRKTRSRSRSRSRSYGRPRLRSRRHVRESTSPIHGLVKLIWNRNKNSSVANRSPSSSSSSSSTPPRNRRGCISPPFSSSRSRSRSSSPQNNNSNQNLSSLSKEKTDKKNSLPVLVVHEENVTEEKPALPSVVVRPVEQNKKLVTLQSSVRCRDFDERGLCMRGERCPYDHGQDPVVLEDISLLDHINVQPSTYKQDFGHPGFSSSRQFAGPWYPRTGGEYYPENPGVEARVGWLNQPAFRHVNMGPRCRPGLLPRPMGPFPMAHQRELINVPVMDVAAPAPNHMGYGVRGPHEVHQPMMRDAPCGRGRFGFDHGRLGPKPAKNFANCSIEVKKIPRDQNTIMDLNKYFLRFGKILNIQVNFKNDPEAALVTFSSPMEAKAAYKCPEAVLNNRFIRLFWHKNGKENEDVSIDSRERERGSSKDAFVVTATEEVEKQEPEVPGIASDSEKEKDAYAQAQALLQKETEILNKALAVEAIKRSQEMLAEEQSKKRLQEERKKESIRLLADLVKRKQILMEDQIEQQKKLIGKLEANKGSMKAEEREELMKLIKSLQQSIENIKNGI